EKQPADDKDIDSPGRRMDGALSRSSDDCYSSGPPPAEAPNHDANDLGDDKHQGMPPEKFHAKGKTESGPVSPSLAPDSGGEVVVALASSTSLEERVSMLERKMAQLTSNIEKQSTESANPANNTQVPIRLTKGVHGNTIIDTVTQSYQGVRQRLQRREPLALLLLGGLTAIGIAYVWRSQQCRHWENVPYGRYIIFRLTE
ncbi:hypothetical protein K474DRAFT_1681036, partial [Panus rudis PR-1116 ss-1]